MATAQTSQSKASKARQAASRSSSRQSDTEELSGERDEHYNLISVLYHGLQGADQCTVYADDADGAGDDELVEFLRASGKQQGQIAKQAKLLLLQRFGGSAGGSSGSRKAAASDDEDDDDEDK